MRRGTLIFAGLVAALLAGCASPNPDLYTLAAVPGAVVPAHVRGVELRRIGLAGYLDRSEIVHAAVQYRLHVSDRERWGEPLGTMIGRVFTEDLLQRLPGTDVYAEAGAITSRPDLVLEVDIQRFDTDASGVLVLLAQVAARPDDSHAAAREQVFRVTVTPTGPDTTALVAAMSAALGQLADHVAGLLTG